MITIDKSNVAIPMVLTTSGRWATESNNHGYLNGKRIFSFSKNIYGHASVKRARCHTDRIANEDPLIINPADDPSIDLYFDREVIRVC